MCFRLQGVVLGQAMLQYGYIECVTQDSNQFCDNGALYRIIPAGEIVREDIRRDSSAGNVQFLDVHFLQFCILGL